MISLSINGRPQQFPAPLSIAELVIALELSGKRIAVEQNGEIVPRSQYGTARVADGDQFEIVVAVGGG